MKKILSILVLVLSLSGCANPEYSVNCTGNYQASGQLKIQHYELTKVRRGMGQYQYYTTEKGLPFNWLNESEFKSVNCDK